MSESTVTVKANQATTDWQDGAIFTVERTDYIDKLLDNGILSIYIPDGDPLYVGDDVVLGERYDLDAAPLTDEDAKAAGFDLDNPDDLPPAAIVGEAEGDINSVREVVGGTDVDDAPVLNVEPDTDEQQPSTRRTRAKKSDDVSE